jgi:hypothetical protein
MTTRSERSPRSAAGIFRMWHQEGGYTNLYAASGATRRSTARAVRLSAEELPVACQIQAAHDCRTLLFPNSVLAEAADTFRPAQQNQVAGNLAK